MSVCVSICLSVCDNSKHPLPEVAETSGHMANGESLFKQKKLYGRERDAIAMLLGRQDY